MSARTGTRIGVRVGTRIASESLRFSFDGLKYFGQNGDTAASALLANGVRAMGRSVKYRRLRGLLAAGPEEPNALFTVGDSPTVIPNVSAPQLVLRDGMVLRSQNRWPSLKFDVASLLQAGEGFLGAGFYYKTFIWPSWKTYEKLIRNLAGLGEAPGACTLPPPRIMYASCDVLIAGAGPAGLAAALAAARTGANVWLFEREPVVGGELEFEASEIDGLSAQQWIATTLAELTQRGAKIFTDTTIMGGSSDLIIAHREAGGIAGENTVYRIKPRAMVAAMGAVERPIVFMGNDRPGVMLINAAEKYLARYGVKVGDDLVLFANHDRVYAAAARLQAGGMRIRAIIDTRPTASEAIPLRADLMRSGIHCLLNTAVLATTGRQRITGVKIAPLDAPHQTRILPCDTVLVGGGWSPPTHQSTQSHLIAGAEHGYLELNAALNDGYTAGRTAAQVAGKTDLPGSAPRGHGDMTPSLVPFWRSPSDPSREKYQFVDLQNDVTVTDLRAALSEGFNDIEHVKRYTTLGVGTEQGRTSGLLGASIVAELRGDLNTQVTPSRARPPYYSMTLSSLAGLRVGAALRPTRRTALHQWHESNGGVLESLGLWMRPRYYRANGADAFTAGIAEAKRVRDIGGIIDSSTLGKIEIAGPDAAAFLDTLYLTKASTIKVGRSKYMVNLREDGMVLDDGIVLRLATNRFLATVSSGHAEHMLSHFEYYCVEGHDAAIAGTPAISRIRAVSVTDVTESWSVIAVAGATSRNALRQVLGDAWHTHLATLSHMDFAVGTFQNHDIKLLRASFSGELAFELHCRPAVALALWEGLIAAGLSPYGLEALDILRVEKGYLVSSELNGQTTPFDLGMDGLVKIANNCVGFELLNRPAFHEASRPRLVGLKAVDGRSKFLAGAQLVGTLAPGPCGHVTSTVYSPTLNEWIGLGLVARNLELGTTLIAKDPLRSANTRVLLVPPVHFDPSGARMKSMQ